jgi:hypothetical protein
MNKFYNFLESIKEANPALIEGVQKAYNILHEGLATDEALDEADMRLEHNTEEKLGGDAPLVDEFDLDEAGEPESMDVGEVETMLDELL